MPLHIREVTTENWRSVAALSVSEQQNQFIEPYPCFECMNRILSLRSSYRTNLRLPGANSGGVWDGHVHTAIFIKDNQQGPTV